MFQSAKNEMPASDYVSVVSSLFADKFALWVGTLASAVASAIAGAHAGAPVLYVFSALFFLVALWRYRQARAFSLLTLGAHEAVKAQKWESKATVSGSMAALLYGAWCFVSLVIVKEEFAVLASLIVTMAAMVGVVARNYGLDRLIVLQLTLLGVPICLGLVLDGNIYHVFLAVLFIPMMMSYRALARDVRNVLLRAVHDRDEVTRLAVELDTALSTMSHGLLMLDEQLEIVVANEQIQEMLFGESDFNCIGKRFTNLIDQSIACGQITPLAGQRLSSMVTNQGEVAIVLQLLDGRHCEFTINRDQNQTVLVISDITERIQSESRIKFMARFDPSTNLPNRAFFSEQVVSQIRLIQQSGTARDVGMLILDIDDFKIINDHFGHPMGDRVLSMIARRLRQTLDSNVLVGRLGGDEFVAFFESVVSTEQTNRVIDGLLDTLAEPFSLDQHHFEIRTSAGLVVSSSDECDLEALLKRADLALYESKRNGKGVATLFTKNMCMAFKEKQTLKLALRKAIANGDLQLAYQPVMDIQSRRVVGCEALARWHDPELGIVPPDKFIPLAEEMGIVSKITDWALRTATMECATWPHQIGVAVNISAWDFKGSNVQDLVYSALNKAGLSPDRLEIEVTESVLVEELETASKVLAELSAQGVGIALDDFGTGYSSLGYLHNLPFTKLKIDRTFTMDLTSDPKARRLMRNIAVLGRDLNMKITVEGVETQEQLDVVANIGLINSVQGYLFGAPVPQSEIAALICALSGGERGPKTLAPTHKVGD